MATGKKLTAYCCSVAGLTTASPMQSLLMMYNICQQLRIEEFALLGGAFFEETVD